MANIDRLGYDHSIALISERSQALKDEYQSDIEELMKNNERLTEEMQKREDILATRAKEMQQKLQIQHSKQEAAWRQQARQERQELLRHVSILEELMRVGLPGAKLRLWHTYPSSIRPGSNPN